jgi:hypothetical protein
MVASPLLVTRIPALLRRQAAPFLILAGVITLATTLVPDLYSMMPVGVVVSYTMGWTRLRGRPPLVLFAGLGTGLLVVVGGPLSQLLLPTLPWAANPPTLGTQLAWSTEASFFTTVLPVCIPVLLTGINRFLGRSVSAAPDDLAATRGEDRAGWNTFAVASLVFGLVLASPMAIVFGHIARSQIRRTHEQGAGLTVWGMVLGYLEFVVLAVVALLANIFAADLHITL